MIPIIGITECSKYEFYEYAIEQHGGEAKQLRIGVDHSDTKIDGLLLPGGGDIDPELYGEKQHPKTKNVNRTKDNFEILLFKEAIEQDIPVFGICRGIQIMNIAMGGSLYQDIEDLYPRLARNHKKKLGGDDWHDITIEHDTTLMKIVRASTDRVNSAHHQTIKRIGYRSVNTAHTQAINDIGEELIVTARSEDGIIEAMEYPAKSFVIAVQYHPERMGLNRKPPYPDGELLEHAAKLFEAFIRAASGNSVS